MIQPTLNRLAALTSESFSAVVLDQHEVVIVARSGSDSSAIAAYAMRASIAT